MGEMIIGKATPFCRVCGEPGAVQDGVWRTRCGHSQAASHDLLIWPKEAVAELAQARAERERARHGEATGLLKARVAALTTALREIVDNGDFTAPEGMKRIARDALLSAAPATPVVVDQTVPPGEVHFRDATSGKTLGKIVGLAAPATTDADDPIDLTTPDAITPAMRQMIDASKPPATTDAGEGREVASDDEDVR